MIEPDLISYITGDAAIAAIIGEGSPATYRIYPEILPQGPDLPALTLTRVSTQHPELADGSPDLAFGYFQISCWGLTAKAVAELAALVRIRLMGIGGTNFQKAGIQDERSGYEPDTKFYRQDVDARIAYAMSSPA